MKTTNGKSIMKKTTILFLSIGCLTSLSLMTLQAQIPLVNADFSANTARASFFNDDGSIIVGAVPGWTPAGTGVWNWGNPFSFPTGDSGIVISSESDSTPHMYLAGYDPAVQQTTPTSLALGIYWADFQLGGEWSSENAHVTEVSLYADDGVGDQVVFASEIFNFPDNYTMNWYHLLGCNTSFDGGDGWTIGIQFQNITRNDVDGSAPGWGTSYTTVDNVSIETWPEPSTTALLTLGGLCALVVRRRRRA
jgi:hypothetical protein